MGDSRTVSTLVKEIASLISTCYCLLNGRIVRSAEHGASCSVSDLMFLRETQTRHSWPSRISKETSAIPADQSTDFSEALPPRGAFSTGFPSYIRFLRLLKSVPFAKKK